MSAIMLSSSGHVNQVILSFGEYQFHPVVAFIGSAVEGKATQATSRKLPGLLFDVAFARTQRSSWAPVFAARGHEEAVFLHAAGHEAPSLVFLLPCFP